MTKLLRFAILFILSLVASLSFAQNHGKWTVTLDRDEIRAGEAAQVQIKIEIDEGWHTYKLGQAGGPQGLELEIVEQPGLIQLDQAVGPEPLTKFDNGFKIDVGYYKGSPVFGIPIRIDGEALKGAREIKARIRTKYQFCDETSCDRPTEEFLDVTIPVAPGETRTEFIVASIDPPTQPEQVDPLNKSGGTGENPAPVDTGVGSSADSQKPPQTLMQIFLAGIVGGLLALVTPCVFPMIPVTISFFSKQNPDDKRGHMKAALLYCFGIVASFTTLGMLVTIALGKNGTQILASNIWVNLALFLLFIVLAISLFGVFELVLPASFVTKISGNSNRGGFIAPLLMGLTFALTSFTCTVPVVGSLLAGAASGDRIFPIVGMLGFSGALAFPFLLLAFFPKLMQQLPKAGTWMVTAKIFMGFLELAAALKFLSNIDMVMDWQIITQPVFLAIWSTIFIVAGLHLYGWIKLPKEGNPKIGVVRRAFAVLSFGTGLYCLAGMNGANMGQVAGLLPAKEYGQKIESTSGVDPSQIWLKEPHSDAKAHPGRLYEQALAASKESGKPLLIDFTGIT